MDRREVLGVLGATAAGLVTASGTAAFGQQREAATEQHDGHDQHGQMGKETAKSCSDCANECEAGFHHCHQQVAAGKREYARAEHFCVDTATMCYCGASLCARSSPLMGVCCEACAKCCDACIAECEKLNDPELKGVIDACRKTAESCRQMAQMMGGATGGRERGGQRQP